MPPRRVGVLLAEVPPRSQLPRSHSPLNPRPSRVTNERKRDPAGALYRFAKPFCPGPGASFCGEREPTGGPRERTGARNVECMARAPGHALASGSKPAPTGRPTVRVCLRRRALRSRSTAIPRTDSPMWSSGALGVAIGGVRIGPDRSLAPSFVGGLVSKVIAWRKPDTLGAMVSGVADPEGVRAGPVGVVAPRRAPGSASGSVRPRRRPWRPLGTPGHSSTRSETSTVVPFDGATVRFPLVVGLGAVEGRLVSRRDPVIT